jgi:hypothetical protein
MSMEGWQHLAAGSTGERPIAVIPAPRELSRAASDVTAGSLEVARLREPLLTGGRVGIVLMYWDNAPSTKDLLLGSVIGAEAAHALATATD